MLITVLGGHRKCKSSPSHACSWNVRRIPGKKSVTKIRREEEDADQRVKLKEMMRVVRRESGGRTVVRMDGWRGGQGVGQKRRRRMKSQTATESAPRSQSRRGCRQKEAEGGGGGLREAQRTD